MSTASRVYVLERLGARSALVAPWLDAERLHAELVEDFDEDWEPPDDAALVVTSAHYQVRDLLLLQRLLDARRVGVLVLADGILEYRNTWENPELPPGALFQPVRAHKVACIGRSQARVLEGWGNVGRCEVVGLPRLDAALGRAPARRARAGMHRILVASAKSPGFTEEQRATLLRSFADLHHWHGRHPRVGGAPLEIVWRLTGGLADRLGIDAASRSHASEPIASILDEVDAVVTSPSTVQLEAMLRGLPVAVLDYTNSPLFVPAAWTVTAPRHLESVIPALLEPAAARRAFQDGVLHDALECHSPATPRLRRLVEAMRDAVAERRLRGEPPTFAPRILDDERSGFAVPVPSGDPAALFPELRVGHGEPTGLRAEDEDRTRLRAEVAQLRHLARREPELVRELDAWRREAREWRRRYGRLAGAPGIRELLWLRARLRRSRGARP